ncbi:MAG: hypothetical protein DHS20C12_24770 [Pseudohongiella sp.]|nr:MAG: hypothetical protein DHS20C12_24770 [Pseudohongiella sp.]
MAEFYEQEYKKDRVVPAVIDQSHEIIIMLDLMENYKNEPNPVKNQAPSAFPAVYRHRNRLMRPSNTASPR